MWQVESSEPPEFEFNRWVVKFYLSNTDGSSTICFLNFGDTLPTETDIQIAGRNEATKRNVLEAATADTSNTLTQQEFFDRFTIKEVATIYAAAAVNPTVLAYIKRLEMSPRVHKDNPDLMVGLPLLEAAQLIAPGRAKEIMNW